MAEERRVTIRLPADLYAQLEARGRQGQPLAAIVREALIDYLSRQPTAMRGAEQLATTVADMAASLTTLQTQVQDLTTRVEAWAAGRPPAAASPTRNRQPTAAVADDTPPTPYDPTRYVLGRLCPRRHDYAGTGQSLRKRSNHSCQRCDVEQKRARRQRQRRQLEAHPKMGARSK